MARRKSIYDLHPGPDEYVKAFGKKSRKLDGALAKLSGHEKRKTPALDMALAKLSGREKRRTPRLDEALRRLSGRRMHS